jgi:hypothetical protein
MLPGRPSGGSIHARDLDADGEPEVVLDLYTGGAHCCFRTQIFTYSAPGYARAAVHDWGNATARLKDVDRDGTAEVKSADGRFAYAFTSYAFSALPVRILRWRDDRLFDATQAFRHAVRKDARHWMRQYRHASIDPRGVLAAWAADRYRLGHRAAARRFLRRAVRPAFALRVDRKLRRWLLTGDSPLRQRGDP